MADVRSKCVPLRSSTIDGWVNLEPIQQSELSALLKVQSSVFSVYITARVPTGEERIEPNSRREDIEREEPLLNRSLCKHACVYREYLTDDAHLVLANLRSAADLGAAVLNHARVDTIVREGQRLMFMRPSGEKGAM